MGRTIESLARSSRGRALVLWSGAPAASTRVPPGCAVRLFSRPRHAHLAPAADGHHH